MEKDQENQQDSMIEYGQDSPGPEKVAPLGVSADKPLQGKRKFLNMKKSAEVEDMKDGAKVKDHCCVECKKRFSSGKALGGHISMAHVQANRDFSLTRLKSKKKPLKKLVGSSSTDYRGKNVCKICGKDFPTNRSLFGHMKCHPDRAWRGMDPPAEDAINFSEPEFEAVNRVPQRVLDGDQIDSGPVVASSAVGLNESVKWQVTGQRGRAPTKPVIDSLPLTSSDEILAVRQLVRLLDGDSRKPSEDLDSTNKNSWISAKSAPPAATPDKYIFSTCRESFSTPIALGGQRSSHKEIKVRIYNTIDDQSSNGASYAKDQPKVNAIQQLEVNKALGIQNQYHCTGECNHPDHITSTDEAKKRA